MALEPLLAGVDAGTTSIRALVFTPAGEVAASAARPTPTERPRPGWAEHDPEALWRAACEALREATAAVDDVRRIVGIAVASVGEAFIALDAAGRPTCPIIACYDERPRDELARLEDEVGRERLHRLTGLSPDPTFTLAKLLWLRAHRPEALARTARWLNVAHYLAWRLSGVAACDLSLASRSLALDLHRRVWALDLIRELGIDPRIFAPLRPSGSRLGPVTAEAAAATGLPASCVVGLGGHDHILGALAVGALETGILLDSMGTAEALTLALDQPSADGELLRRGYNQGAVEVEAPRHYVFGGFPTSGACIEWFRTLFAAEVDHGALIAEAEAVPPGSLGVTFLPDLRGRLSPVPDPLARGAWFGLAADSTRGQLFRAVLEGLAFEARLTVDSLLDLPGLPAIEAIRAIGGNTRNDLLMRIKASVYGRGIAAAEMPEATALGAALMGGLAAGVFTDLGAARAGLHHRWREVSLVEAWTAGYDARHRRLYAPAYGALRALHHTAATLGDRP